MPTEGSGQEPPASVPTLVPKGWDPLENQDVIFGKTLCQVPTILSAEPQISPTTPFIHSFTPSSLVTYQFYLLRAKLPGRDTILSLTSSRPQVGFSASHHRPLGPE